MDEDTEVLDWGNEDDELHLTDSQGVSQLKPPVDGRNVGEHEDDAVSLGDDEDEDQDPRFRPPMSQADTETAPPSTPRASSSSQPNGSGKPRDIHRESSVTSQKSSRPNDSPSLRRTQSLSKMIHALPPKPVAAPPLLLHSPPIQNTLASTMVRRDRKSNGQGKHDTTSQSTLSLPPDWEERYPRDDNSRGPYYYNVKTQKATWVHPAAVSLSTDRDSNDARSPKRDSTREETNASRKLQGRRRSSLTGPLSYEDRHYRPNDDASLSGPTKSVDSRDVYSILPPRPESPRIADSRRVARVSTPPLRRRSSVDQGRGVRSRRERSPPVDHNRRDRPGGQAQLSSEDRTWVPPRKDSSPPRNADNRSKALRGRRDRSPPPQSTSVPQGARNDINEWTASRPHSPPSRMREVSPPRRYSNATAVVDRSPSSPPRLKSRHGRPSSPPRFGHADSYTPPDNVPQRRGREDDPVYDADVKRRRMDLSPSSTRTREFSDDREQRAEKQSEKAESRSYKRAPLPPQSARFREASKNSPSEPVRHDYTSQQTGFTSQAPPLNRDREVPSASARSRSRFGDGNVYTREGDAMDVDHMPRPVPSRLMPASSSDRGPASPGVLPTGPRAMNKTTGSSYSPTPPILSPNISGNNMRLPPQDSNWQRAQPPHMRTDIPPTLPDQNLLRTSQAISDERSGKLSRKATGSNSTPIGDRRPIREPPTLDVPIGPIADRYRPQPTHDEAERGRYQDGVSGASTRSASYQSESPVDRLKILPPSNEPISRWPAREEARNNNFKPSPPAHRSLPSRREVEHNPSVHSVERVGRATRFGPERSQAVPDNEDRRWLTREEAEHLTVQTSSTSQRRGSFARPPTPSGVLVKEPSRLEVDTDRHTEDESHRPLDDHGIIYRDVGKGGGRDERRNDNRRSDRSVMQRRPSLERRLSFTRDREPPSFEARLSDRFSTIVDESHTGTASRAHQDRAYLPASEPELEELNAIVNGGRNPHTARSRKKGRPFDQNGGLTLSHGDHDTNPESKQRDMPSPPRRGATLLDRLTEPGPDSPMPPPSLRDRVDLPLSGIAGLPPRPPVDLSFEAFNDSGKRRRNIKPRKGKKSSA